MIRHFAAHARDFSHARRKKSSGAMKNDREFMRDRVSGAAVYTGSFDTEYDRNIERDRLNAKCASYFILSMRRIDLLDGKITFRNSFDTYTGAPAILTQKLFKSPQI